ncbi:DNA gyrase subunit A, partial [Roseburia faecis]|nr:DNA gyrase subunit A [Roseburia faecis]
GDELIHVNIIDGQQNMILGTRLGYAVSFNAEDVRSMGRSAAGVRGAKLREGDCVIGAAPLDSDSNVFVISENGFGKQTPAAEYPIKGRGGKGIKTVNVTAKNGPL